MIIKNKEEFKKIVEKFNFRFAKTYAKFAPHEYIVSNEEGEMLESILLFNKSIVRKVYL